MNSVNHGQHKDVDQPVKEVRTLYFVSYKFFIWILLNGFIQAVCSHLVAFELVHIISYACEYIKGVQLYHK